MKYNEIERLQQLAGILAEIKINKPLVNPIDNYIRRNFKPFEIGEKENSIESYIFYKLNDGTIIIYYPKSKKITSGGAPKNSRTHSIIQKYINSLK